MCELGVDFIETLFLTLPEISKPLLNLATLKRFWAVSMKIVIYIIIFSYEFYSF